MTVTKRIICLLLGLLMLMLCACSDNSDEQAGTDGGNTVDEQKEPTSITLPIAYNDTLDPFRAESAVNRSLVTLLYDGLIYIDENFEPQLLLASSYTLNDKALTVALASAAFSDGSTLTADDVTYSFEKAKQSDYYSARLSNLKSASAVGNSVTFTLGSTDIFALSCLDFPIVKRGTVQAISESTKLYNITPPIGCGRYEIDGIVPVATLKSNPSCIRKDKTAIDIINLFQVSDSDGMAYGLQIGNYDYWYNDLSNGEYSRVNAGVSVVPTNNIIYIAFNSNKAIFRQVEVRKAVSMLINRDEITSQSFQGHGTPSVLPFNPNWAQTKNITPNGKTVAQAEQAISLLESAGYKSINAYGYRSSNSLSLTANLVVCKSNSFKKAAAQQIKEQLAEANFNVRITELSTKEYKKAVEEGNFDMYLGEIKITPNMDLSSLFKESGIANAAVWSEDDGGRVINQSSSAYFDFKSGKMSMSDFCNLFEQEAPFVPVCYRSGIEIYSRSFKTEITGTCYDNFYNIGSWSIDKTSK